MKIKRVLEKLKLRLKFCYYEWKRRGRIKGDRKIRVVFLGYALGASCDVFSGLYKLFAKDDRFEPYVVIVPNNYGTKNIMISLQHEAGKYLEGMQIPFISGYNEADDTFVDVEKMLDPDIVFMTHHYEWFPKVFQIRNFRNKIVYITPYSYLLAENISNTSNTKSYRNAHKCFMPSELTATLFRKTSLVYNGNYAPFLGYLKSDPLIYAKSEEDVWPIKDPRVKRIIWAPHHLDAPLSNFLEYHELFLKLAENDTNIQIAFRPHPGLKGSLKRMLHWSDERIADYWQRWADLPNAFVSEGKFVPLFQYSDAMILDSISFLAEYMLTGKPALAHRPHAKDFPFNAFGQELRSHLYHAESWEDTLVFIDNVVIKGNDEKREERLNYVKSNLYPPNGRTAAENTYLYVCKDIGMEGCLH